MKTRNAESRTKAGLISLLLFAAGGMALAQDGASPEADDDPLLLKTSIDLTYQYTYRSQDVLVEEAAINKGAPYAASGIDLKRNVLDLPPFASVDWELGRKQGLAIGFDAELRKQLPSDSSYDALFYQDNFLSLGNPKNPVAFEKNMIRKGALYWRSDTLDLTFGRDKVDLGDGLKGSLYPSPRLPYLDAFQAKGKLGRLGMNWIVATSRATGSWDKVDVNPNWQLSSPYTPADESSTPQLQQVPTALCPIPTPRSLSKPSTALPGTSETFSSERQATRSTPAGTTTSSSPTFFL